MFFVTTAFAPNYYFIILVQFSECCCHKKGWKCLVMKKFCIGGKNVFKNVFLVCHIRLPTYIFLSFREWTSIGYRNQSWPGFDTISIWCWMRWDLNPWPSDHESSLLLPGQYFHGGKHVGEINTRLFTTSWEALKKIVVSL